MWFATENGLSRFDGKNFKTFTTKDGLPDNEILKIFIYHSYYASSTKRRGPPPPGPGETLLADAEVLEDVMQQIVRRAASGDLLQMSARLL